jgi:methionyl-tRNA formyltransferase
MVTCAYGQILSQEILDIAPLGVINVHGSILPEYRGSAPIQRALIDGKTETGITIMKTDIGMDSGDILAIEKLAIEDGDYVSDLYRKLSEIGAKLLIETLDKYISGQIIPIKQDESKVTFAPPLKKEESVIDFSRPATEIRNTMRGFGYAVCSYKGTPIKIYNAETVDLEGDNGEVLRAQKKELVVACGDGALKINELQMSGKKKMATADFLNGVKIAVGDKFE